MQVGSNALINIIAQFQMESKTAAYFALALGCGLPILESLHHTSPLIISKAPSQEAWGRFRTVFITYFKRYLIDVSNTWCQHLMMLGVWSDEHKVEIWNSNRRLTFDMDTLEYRDSRMGISILFNKVEELMKFLLQKIEYITIDHR